MIKLRAHSASTNLMIQMPKKTYSKQLIKTWEPKETHHTVSTFIDVINNEIQQEQMNNRKTLPNQTYHKKKKCSK